MSMMCSKPYAAAPGMYVSCGTCKYCRINKSRVWQHRIMLEEQCWEVSCFATLTYDEMFVPEDYSVRPRALQLFMKRLRRKLEPLQIRFYGVGEYGDPRKDELHGIGRPHYHVCLFGVGTEWRYDPYRKQECCFSFKNVVEDSWPCGFVHIGEVNKQSARYITNYVTKFMNFEKSHALKCFFRGEYVNRLPEFSRMSNRPGIGATAIKQMAKILIEEGYPPDKVVDNLNHGRKVFPFGPYLAKKLHELRGGDLAAEGVRLNEYLDDFGIHYLEWKGVFTLREPSRYRYIMESKKAQRFKVDRNPIKRSRTL